MNRNFSLLSILILLLIGTFYFQEKRIETNRIAAEEKDTLFLGEIIQLKLPNVDAVKKNDQWWDLNDLLSYNILKQIEKKLKEIRKIKEVSGPQGNFFSSPIQIEVNNQIWIFGDLSLDKQAFYVSKGKNIFLAEIVGESKELTANQNEIASIKLNELLRYLTKRRKDLLENQLFRFYPGLPMEMVTFVLDGHLPFELNFVTNTTLPPPIPGVFPHKDLKKKFLSLLNLLVIKEKLPYGENLKKRKLGQITFSNQKSSIQWELWLRDSKTADAVLIDPNQKKAYQMYGGTLKVFFISIQEYWDKKVIADSQFVSFDRLPVKFSQGKKTANVTILNREPLDYETSSDFKIDRQNMEDLIQIILNLGPREQSDRVSILSNSERKQLLYGDHLHLEVMGQKLILWRKTSELIVANMTQGFKTHFFTTNQNFRGSFQDVLK